MTSRLLPSFFLGLGLAVGGCYSPQLPAIPFYCSTMYPECPDNYTCDFDHCTTPMKGKCNCIATNPLTGAETIAPATGPQGSTLLVAPAAAPSVLDENAVPSAVEIIPAVAVPVAPAVEPGR